MNWWSPSSCSRRPNCSLASTTIDRPSGVSSAREASCAVCARSSSATPLTGRNSAAWRFPSVIVPVLSRRSTSTSPDASTARPDMASTLRCTSRSMPGDADGREEGADRRRDQGDQESDEDGLGQLRPGVDREGAQGHGRGEEGDRQPGEQDVERDLVRGLPALCALDEGDHAIEEGLSGLLRDLDHEAVREQPGAARDRRAVTARLADHRSGLAGDRGLVHRAHALDDLAVCGDDLARLDHHDVAAPQLRGRHLLEPAGVRAPERDGRGAGRAQRVGLCLAAPLCDRLREVREQDREPEPQRDGAGEPERLAVLSAEEILEEDRRRDDAADLDDEDDGVAEEGPRVELQERVLDRREDDVLGEDAGARPRHGISLTGSPRRDRG